MVGSRSEDTLLFFALTPKIIKIKPIYKMLSDFADKKQSYDLSDRFNIILFQESGPIYLNDFTLNFENILSLLKDYEGKIVRANIAGGIFLAATFIIDVFKKISDKAFRLIIIMDRGAYRIPENYLPVLYNLLDKIKDMPFYLDILSLGTEDFEEYSKLENLTKRYGGKIYEIKNPKMLQEILLKLAEKKRFFEDSYMSRSVLNKISISNQPFYENLADDPKILITLETCSICFKKDDKTVVQCPNCDTIAHMSCWANWAKTSNIGMPYVFRCHICFNLLKLDKEFVEIVQTGKIPTPEIEPKRIDLVSFLKQLESQQAPQVIQVEDPLAVPEESFTEDFETEKAITGQESMHLRPILEFSEPIRPEPISEVPKPSSLEPIPVFSEPIRPEPISEVPKPSSLEPIPVFSEPVRPEPISEVPKPSSLESIPRSSDKSSVKTSKSEKREKDVKIVFCPSCSKVTTNLSKKCPNCGFPLI